MEATVGRLLYKFKIKSRRHTLFFIDVITEYFKVCEDAGYEKEMRSVGMAWGYLIITQLVPSAMRKLPPTVVINTVMRRIWANLGLMEDIHIGVKGEIIRLKTVNEITTKYMGPNNLMIGFHEGILSGLFGFQVKCNRASQERIVSKYEFMLTKAHNNIESKDKSIYDSLNTAPPVTGLTLKDALKKNMLKLNEKNEIRFRGKGIYATDNTLFHLLGNLNILLDKVPHISYNYFKKLVDPRSPDDKKLILLKTLLEAMGWGVIKVIVDKKAITFNIDSPPYGLQKGKDNWEFIIRVILGYLWLLNKNIKIKNTKEDYKKLLVTYSGCSSSPHIGHFS